MPLPLGFYRSMRNNPAVANTIRLFVLPFWAIIAIFSMMPVIWTSAMLRKRRMKRGSLQCPACGYDSAPHPIDVPSAGRKRRLWQCGRGEIRL